MELRAPTGIECPKWPFQQKCCKLWIDMSELVRPELCQRQVDGKTRGDLRSAILKACKSFALRSESVSCRRLMGHGYPPSSCALKSL